MKEVVLLLVLLALGSVSCVPVGQSKEALRRKAEEILDRMPVIDGHNDFPTNLRELLLYDLRKVNFSSDLTQVEPWKSSPYSFTDIPRLRQGKVGGQFWAAYTGCVTNYKDSVGHTLEQIDVIRRLVKEYPDDLQFAESAADIEAAIANKKIASLIGVEGGHSIQSSPAILRVLYDLGARYMTLTHNCNTPWSDSALVDRSNNPEPPANYGLSEFGLEIIDEMNRLGMMIDISHVSADTMRAALRRSKAPVIFSHSNTRAVCNHHRNVPDDVIHLVKENDGLIMINFYHPFVQCDSSKNSTIADIVAHMNHIKNLIGASHVGIGADYDGMDIPTQGLEDVSKYPDLFAALLETGEWTEEELEQVSGRNLIRVLKQVEVVRDSLRNNIAMQTTIARSDVVRANISTSCSTAKFSDDLEG